MCRCIVSMKGKGYQWHSIETDAPSLFAAAYAGIQVWCRLWWYDPDAVITVQAGEQRWFVRAQRVSDWYSEQLRKGSDAVCGPN